MALYTRKTIIVAATESTYGTDATPAGSDAILVTEPTITPMMGNTVERNNGSGKRAFDSDLAFGFSCFTGIFFYSFGQSRLPLGFFSYGCSIELNGQFFYRSIFL